VAKSFFKFYTERSETDSFKTAKGPDFVSRLRGHLNIAGINCGEEADQPQDGAWEGNVGVGPVLMFRRAVLLRSLLEQHLAKTFDKDMETAKVDDGVIQAFLKVGKYEHGARSMQAIVQMMRVSSRGSIQKSSLPAAAQLNMHVSAAEFLDLVHRAPPVQDIRK
jgi:hypothetical protein